MGEIAEAMLDGTFCTVCGEFIGEGDGFARACAACEDDYYDGFQTFNQRKLAPAPKKARKLTPCPVCGKCLKGTNSMLQHVVDAHGRGQANVFIHGPELLAALKEALPFIGYAHHVPDVVAKAVSAIAKAEDQSQ